MKNKKWTKKMLSVLFLLGTGLLVVGCSLQKSTFDYNVTNLDSQVVVNVIQDAMAGKTDSGNIISSDLDGSAVDINCKDNKYPYMCSNGHFNYQKITGIYWTNDPSNHPTIDPKHLDDINKLFHFDFTTSLNSQNFKSEIGNINKASFNYLDFFNNWVDKEKGIVNPYYVSAENNYVEHWTSTLYINLWYAFVGNDNKNYYIQASMTFIYTGQDGVLKNMVLKYQDVKPIA